MTTSLVKKSAPMVALYCVENCFLTNWFIRLVLPTPESPRMMTLRRTFFLAGCCDMFTKEDVNKESRLDECRVEMRIFLVV